MHNHPLSKHRSILSAGLHLTLSCRPYHTVVIASVLEHLLSISKDASRQQHPQKCLLVAQQPKSFVKHYNTLQIHATCILVAVMLT
jgi:hypothetical protein